MKCKKCKREIAENSIFCNWCGAKQLREKNEERIPAPRKLPSGSWTIQLMIDGKRYSGTFSTSDEAKLWAKETKSHAKDLAGNPGKMTVQEALDKYIEDRSAILSPSTITGYTSNAKYRFENLRKMKVADVTDAVFQAEVNAEVKSGLSAKTVRNSAGLVISAVDKVCGKKLSATLPPKDPPEHAFLEPEQIQPFIDYFRGKRSETAVLLGLHSLRCSEMLALTPEDVSGNTISVHRAKVRNKDGELVLKKRTKTTMSTRVIPIMIPRLKELIPDALPIDFTEAQLYNDVVAACKDLGYKRMGLHGLRHTFASLAAHLKMPEQECMKLGGWSSPAIMKSIYTHVAESDRQASQQAMKNFYKPKKAKKSKPTKAKKAVKK